MTNVLHSTALASLDFGSYKVLFEETKAKFKNDVFIYLFALHWR